MSLFSKKRALVLFGSPRSHGMTRKLLDSFLSGFYQNKDWSVEEVSLYELSPHPCTGCRACAKKEGCSFGDLDGMDKSLRACDLLVVASPVYNSSFPAPLKAWLDRTQRYFEARFSLGMRPPIEKHRDAVLLLTMGSQEGFAVEVCAHQLERAFSVMNTSLAGIALWQGTDQGEQGWETAGRQAAALARRVSGDGALSLRQVREASPELERLQALYHSAFPANERRNLTSLLRDSTGSGEVLSLWRGEEFVGLGCTLLTRKMAHLIYFAVEPSLRGGGLGSQALELFRRRYAPRPLAVDIEEPLEGTPNQAQRLRRKNFYLRGGLLETPVRYRWRGEAYQILSAGPLSPEDWEDFWEDLRQKNPRLLGY